MSTADSLHQARWTAYTEDMDIVRLRLSKLVEGAVPVWQAYDEARQEMDDAWRLLLDTPASLLPARTLALVRAQDAAVAAAREWDGGPARQMMQTQHKAQMATIAIWDLEPAPDPLPQWPTVAETGRERKVDTSAWHLDECAEYRQAYEYGPLVVKVRKEVGAQRAQVRETARLLDLGRLLEAAGQEGDQ